MQSSEIKLTTEKQQNLSDAPMMKCLSVHNQRKEQVVAVYIRSEHTTDLLLWTTENKFFQNNKLKMQTPQAEKWIHTRKPVITEIKWQTPGIS